MAARLFGSAMGLLCRPHWHPTDYLYLAPLGRMALTNYLMHSLILQPLFLWHAGGLLRWRFLGTTNVIVLTNFSLQIILSSWWSEAVSALVP